jgi:outer membrane protein assembly factor BamB
VADGKVITYGVRGTLSCLDASSGKHLWRKDGGADAWPVFFTACSPLIADGVCIAQLGGPKDGAIVALDLATGAEKWKWTGDGSAYASPILGTIAGAKVIVAQSDKRLVVVNSTDGKLLWETPFAGSGMGGMNSATPILDGQTLVFSGTARGTKAVKLDKQGGALSAAELWTNRDNSIQYNSPVLKGGLIFGLSNRDVLFCINEKDGTTAWTSQITGKRGYGSIVDAGTALALLTPAGNLVAFEPSGKEFKQLAIYKVADGDTVAYPVLTGNQIFVKDKDSVTLWTVD